MLIHRTAVVHPDARLEPGVQIGAYSFIGKDVEISSETIIGSHVIIDKCTRIGQRNKIYSHAILGTDPQDLSYKGDQSWLEIGNDNIIREMVTINRASKEGEATKIGNNCMIMTSCHIAHDCKIGNRVIMSNLATLAGHCQVEDCAVMGGFSVAHQFIRIGKMAMIGGTAGLMQDVPPYMMAFGPAPARITNVNMVGLKRNNVPSEVRRHIKIAFKILFRQKLGLNVALERIKSEIPTSEWIDHLVLFLENRNQNIHSRGISRVLNVEPKVPVNDEYEFDEFSSRLPAT